MFPAHFRLPGKLFPHIKNQGQYHSSRHLALIVSPPQKNQTYPRIGFIVSKKTSSLATTRNRLKRLMRQATMTNLPNLKLPYNIIIIAKPTIATLSLAQINQEIRPLFKQI